MAATARGRASGPFAADDQRWAAVCGRDRRADGVFWYSVRTTGVYCRPSCASRQARRENVRFHASREEAERAGFRPCQRCRPDEPPASARNADAVSLACRLLGGAEPPTLDALARATGMSRAHFQRVFKAVAGVTPGAYAAARRSERVRQELRSGATVTEAVYGAGFSSSGRFYAASPGALGMTPSRFRAGGRGEVIRFAVGACALGSVLVAATPRGVCAILLGDDPEALVRDLQDRFPRAELVGADPGFEGWVARVVALVEAPALGLDLPLDIRGTAFQQRVWQALRDIPPGATVSYRDVAERVGRPGAARAVAGACAANPIAVAIPCHRVVRTDGSLSGYRWGVDRKRALQKRESP